MLETFANKPVIMEATMINISSDLEPEAISDLLS